MDLLIVTALTEEQQVVTAVLNEMATITDQSDNHIADNYIKCYSFERGDGSGCSIGAVCAHQMGATKMSAFVAPLFKVIAPTSAVLVGIAAAVDRAAVSVGDVPFASHVLSYDDIAIENGEMTFRTEGYQSDPEMRKAVGAMRSAVSTYTPWRNECIDIMPRIVKVLNELRQQTIRSPADVSPPHLVVEVGAGGPFLIRDGEFRDSLKELPVATRIKVAAPLHPKLVSVEMESHGFMNAAHELGVRACVLKGISDVGDEEKRQLEKKTGGYYRAYACSNAVLALLHILQRTSAVVRHGRVSDLNRISSLPRRVDEAAPVKTGARSVLEKYREDIGAHPGVLGVGLKEVIVVFVEDGQVPQLPAEIDGVSVIVRSVSPIQVASSLRRWAAEVRGILVGEHSQGLGTVVVGRDGSRLMLTALHVVLPHLHEGHPVHATVDGQRKPAQVYESDYDTDLALLKVDGLIPSESVGSLGQMQEAIAPALGQRVVIDLPDSLTYGIVSTIDGFVKLQSDPGVSGALAQVDGVFMIQPEAPLAPGQSGAIVTTISGTPLGLVVGITRSSDGSAMVAASAIRNFLHSRNLQVELRHETIVVGILATVDPQLLRILNHLESPTRLMSASGIAYWRGQVRDSPNITAVVGRIHEMGSFSGAIAAMELLQEVSPDVVLGVGLAGGVGESLRRGDVVISDSVILFTPEHRGLGLDPAIRQTSLHPVGVAAARRAAYRIAKTDVERPERPDGSKEPFFVHIGSIGLADNASSHQINVHRRMLALEMEGAGISAAAERVGIPYLLVRGISDFASTEKTDDWHEYASAAAVSTTMEVIRELGRRSAGDDEKE